MKKSIIALSLALLLPAAHAQSPSGTPPTPEQAFMHQFDGNGDQQVSLEEFLKPSKAQFQYMDKNADGVISREEVAAFAEEMKQRSEQMRRQQGAPR